MGKSKPITDKQILNWLFADLDELIDMDYETAQAREERRNERG